MKTLTLFLSVSIFFQFSVCKAQDAKHVSPRDAALASAVLPGLGQLYNREYWKIPIVYAGLGISTGVFFSNYAEYRKYRNAYRIRMDGNADTIDELQDLFPRAGDVKVRRDVFREYVDYSILAMVILYGLNIVDATVFAHLKNFDMSDGLSFNVRPTIMNNRSIGLSVVLYPGKKSHLL